MSKNTRVSAQSNIASPLKLKPLVSSILVWIHRPITLSLMLGAVPVFAYAQTPTGGTVVAGSATITAPDANQTVIQQGTDKAIINWQSFSIGKDSYVQFIQPGSNSVTLNRVVGADPSQILGHLSANGQIFLVNPNGVYFGQGAVVDVGGIVATTLDINNDDFMRGDYRFSRSADVADSASVINEGQINANGGYVVLAGDYVANKGIVQAQLGTAMLASGDALTLQTSGSSLINYQVDKATVARLAGVENSGQILANGGRVIMTADVANDLAATVVNNTGLVQAQSVVEKDGAVYFEGTGGSVANSGTIDASAQAGANGGKVDIRSTGDINHEADSLINVNGASSGTSNAGSVYTWADGSNNFKEGANITGRGGEQGGNGGQVELSGNQVINRSIVDLRASKGQLGTLTLDPTAITIANGAGTDAGDQSTIYEQNLEAQLKVGNVSLEATGQDASITVASLSDGVLDGSNAGNGGSLSLKANGSGTPAIKFDDVTNTIKVDGDLNLTVANGSINTLGIVNVGNLEAGRTITVKGGSVTTGNLTVAKTINNSTNSSYGIDAHAYAGNLSVGDVKVDVTNTVAAGVSSSVNLQADGGSVTAGSVTSKAAGLGYYNYNWVTGGSAATSYFGTNPWTLASQGDHAISASLNISATGNVSTRDIDVLATDRNSIFNTNLAGYWQTQTDTQHYFWRPTAASATATINAGGNIVIDGKTSVIADGYAMNSYSETESWRTMVNNYNTNTGSQQVVTHPVVNGNQTTHTETNYYDVKGSAKTGNESYIWSYGPYYVINGSSVENSPNVTQHTDTNPDSEQTTRYTGQRGLSSTLDVTAGGSISMDGMDVSSVNHSASGNGTYTDTNWGHQDTDTNLNDTADNFKSADREVDYYDTFSTGYTAAASTSRANITAGTSVSLNGGSSYDVVAGYPASSVPGFASLNVVANNGPLNIASDVSVIGSSASDVTLNLRALNGDINAAGMSAVVTNGYANADGRATVTSDTGNVHLGGLAVSGQRSAYVDVVAAGNLTIDNATSATSTSTSSNGDAAAIVNLTATGNMSLGDVIASSTFYRDNTIRTYQSGNNWHSDHEVYGGSASIDIHSAAGNVALNGDVKASGYEDAKVDVTANAVGKTLTTAVGKTVSATTLGTTYTSTDYLHFLRVPTYYATTTLAADGGLILGSSVAATVTNGNGAALVNLTTTGGSNASISQDSGSLIKASGSTGTVNVNAGSASPTVSNAAILDMLGAIVAQGSTGEGKVLVKAASGTVSGLGASSRDTAASVTVNALDVNGLLTVGGTGTITSNANNGTGALLTLNAAGSLDSSAASITLNNTNTDTDAGASANLTAAHGYNTVGSIGVNGFNSAVLNATAPGAVTAAGAAYTKATGASGHAESKLTSATAGVGIAAGGSIDATANASQGIADVTLTGITGATLDGNATATANSGTANVNVTTTGGSTAAITQGANSSLLATGTNSYVKISAGNATPTAGNAAVLDMHGDVLTRSIFGESAIAIVGKSGAVHDFSAVSIGSAATVDISALNGALDLTGTGSASGSTVGTLNATSTGDLSTRGTLATSVASPSATALTNLTSSNGALLVDAGSLVKASSTQGKSDVNLTAATGMTVNGDVTAQSTSSDATVDLLTTGGSAATIAQGANSTILASGNHGAVTLNAGSATPTAANAAAVALAGDVQARSSNGTADIVIKAASGAVHDFSAESTSNRATVSITSLVSNATLALNGAGSVTANVDNGTGALLKVTGAGSLNTNAADLVVDNLNTGSSAGAKLNLQANGGSATLGQATVTAQGGGDASLVVKAATNLTANRNLSANNLGLGDAAGTALISLSTTGSNNAVSTITQAAGTTISATTDGNGGNGGNATVDVQASDCCTSSVALNGTVKSTVNSGTGDATVGVRGTTVAVRDVASEAKGTGNALLNIGAPSTITLNGAIDVKAADASKRADLKLVADRLTDNATRIKLSTGNGYVQLASFNTNNIIGVNSARDFDASVQTNYTLTTLNKLLGQQAEVTFGGEYDRSAWTQGTPQTAWVPGMASWSNQSQQVGAIHVAGDSNINLAGVKMVFDTTGTTFYHDLKMSSWSVPNGRVATYVMRPATNYDRYLDRTDHNLQNMNKVAEDSFSNVRTSAVAGSEDAAGGVKQIAGDLFLNGEGVNLVRKGSDSGNQADSCSDEGQGGCGI